MSGPGHKRLQSEIAAMQAEVEAMLGVYVDLCGWSQLFNLLAALAARRGDGRISGVLQRAAEFTQ